MRVIQNGNIEELQCKCTNCNSTIGYYPYEVKATSMGIASNNSFIHEDKLGILIIKSIKCPACGSIIELRKETY